MSCSTRVRLTPVPAEAGNTGAVPRADVERAVAAVEADRRLRSAVSRYIVMARELVTRPLERGLANDKENHHEQHEPPVGGTRPRRVRPPAPSPPPSRRTLRARRGPHGAAAGATWRPRAGV